MIRKQSAPLTRSVSGARLKPTNLPGVYSFEPTPPELDRRKAGLKTLMRHGLPVRPRGKGSEIAAHIWDSMMSQRFRHIHPHLRVTSTLNPPRGADGDFPKKPRTKRSKADSTINSPNWSGGLVTVARSKFQPPNIPVRKLVAVYLNWVVPTVRRPDGAPDSDSPWDSAAWVGLDGVGTSGDVLQAGTDHSVSVADDWDNDDPDNLDYYAWYEWFPHLSVAIDNFPVAPGDAMFVYVRFDGPDSNQVNYGFAWLVNRTTAIETSVYFAEPGATPTFANGFQGMSAECIMEQPSQSLPDGSVGPPFSFVHYGEIAFTNFGACADDGTFFSATDLTTVGLNSKLSDGEHSQDIVCRPQS